MEGGGLVDLQAPAGFDAWFATAEIPVEIREWLNRVRELVSAIPGNMGNQGMFTNTRQPFEQRQGLQQPPDMFGLQPGAPTAMPPQGFAGDPFRGGMPDQSAAPSVDFIITRDSRNFSGVGDSVKLGN
jgi:hypothetical protein